MFSGQMVLKYNEIVRDAPSLYKIKNGQAHVKTIEKSFNDVYNKRTVH